MDMDGTSGHDADREAALRAFKERQRPAARSFGPRPTETSDPVGVLALALLCFVLLAMVEALLVGSEHVVIGFFVFVAMLVCGLVALVSGIAAGVEWGNRRSRQRDLD